MSTFTVASATEFLRGLPDSIQYPEYCGIGPIYGGTVSNPYGYETSFRAPVQIYPEALARRAEEAIEFLLANDSNDEQQ